MEKTDSNRSDGRLQQQLPTVDDDDIAPNPAEEEEEEELGQPSTLDQPAPKPHSVFTKREKVFIVAMCSFGAYFSSVSVPIYLPVIPTLKEYFNVTTESMNVTVTIYSIFQGLAPVLWGSLSDSLGRRPVYIVCLVIYIGANIGLALTRWYSMLFVMRLLQAFGVASTVSLSAGVVGDITTREDRGQYMGVTAGLGLIGNAFGPIIGGALASSLGWRSIFWFLVIAASVLIVVLILFLPETNRSLVGDGSIYPPTIVNNSLYITMRSHFKHIPAPRRADDKPRRFMPKMTMKFLDALKLLGEPDVVVVLIPNALHYTTWFMILTAQSTLLSNEYNFTTAKIGYSYLASGIGGLLGSLMAGRIMGTYYRKCVRKYELQCKERGEPVDMRKFNIQQARFGTSYYPSLAVVVASLIFGWTIQYHVHYIVPILSTSLLSFSAVFYVNLCQTLLVDLFPTKSAGSTSIVNLSRCLLCAAGIAAVDKMVDSLKSGGAFTIMAGLCFLSQGFVVLEIKYGQRWEFRRRARLAARAAAESTAATADNEHEK
ncbi:major facilitator superfamily domain-containing protein [Limtongia smithiae]|uniref:major facilitator superfamily domain-containing protein n=1 Tax=Limtongia smithiae TaxID=1125753 RepID=UPI0034CDA399